jgi:hypothetical protein
MTESSCLTTMGRLIDSAISYICMDILAIVDITAEESERLKQLCSILRPIEERFNEMHVSPRLRLRPSLTLAGQHRRLCPTLAALLLPRRNHGSIARRHYLSSRIGCARRLYV